jgi:hypothetical protein
MRKVKQCLKTIVEVQEAIHCRRVPSTFCCRSSNKASSLSTFSHSGGGGECEFVARLGLIEYALNAAPGPDLLR